MTTETHPNWFYDFYPMKILVLGSFPPHPKRHAFPFYYPNKQNRFWRVMSELSGIELKASLSDTEHVVAERKQIVRKLSLGIHDVALEIIRKNNSSLDANIEITKFQDIIAIVNNHPELEKILLLGFSAKNSAAQTFLKYIAEEQLEAEFPENFRLKSEQSFTVFMNDRKMECVILNSTSSASSITMPKLVNQFRKFL